MGGGKGGEEAEEGEEEEGEDEEAEERRLKETMKVRGRRREIILQHRLWMKTKDF